MQWAAGNRLELLKRARLMLFVEELPIHTFTLKSFYAMAARYVLHCLLPQRCFNYRILLAMAWCKGVYPLEAHARVAESSFVWNLLRVGRCALGALAPLRRRTSRSLASAHPNLALPFALPNYFICAFNG